MPVFDAQAFPDSAGVARKVVEYRRSQLTSFFSTVQGVSELPHELAEFRKTGEVSAGGSTS